MRFTLLSSAIILALFSACTVADVDLDPFPTSIVSGENYTLSWTATASYNYSIWLVIGALDSIYSIGPHYTPVYAVAQGVIYNGLSPNYLWTTPRNNVSVWREYALLVNGTSIPSSLGESYSNLTAFFQFTPVQTPNTTMVTSTSSSTSLGSTSSATLSVPTSESSSGTTSSTHHNSLSGRAIAGIVVGVIVLIGLVILGAIFYKWRRKRTAFQKREAAARANRLDPVVSKDSYEMHGRSPPLKFETDI